MFVDQDPIFDESAPPFMDNVFVPSGRTKMNGVLYVANGAGPHPTVIFLHGFPGNERNLDMVHAVTRAGWNVLFFHYRGAWGSGGTFSLANAQDDVFAAIKFVQRADIVEKFRIDPSRIVVAGQSMGGTLSWLAGGQSDAVIGVGCLAPANFGLWGNLFDVPEIYDAVYGLGDTVPMLKGMSGERLVAFLRENSEAWDLVKTADNLLKTPILLVAGKRDTVCTIDQHHAPMLAALKASGHSDVTDVIIDGDHSFSGRRLKLTETLINWLHTLS